MALRLMLALLLLAAAGLPQEPARQQNTGSNTPYVETSEKQFAFYPGGKLEISAAAPGSCRITGWDSAVVRVEMEKIFYYATAEQAQSLAKLYPARISYTQTLAKISTTGSKKPVGNMEINIQVLVPRERTDFNIKMIKGDLAVASFSGSVEATIEEGNIEARDLGGYFSLMTKRGDLQVELSGPRWLGYGFTGATRRGSIDLRLPVDYSAAIQLETRDGKISLDYPEQMIEGESVPLRVLEKKKASAVKEKIGTGGVPIKLMTATGNIIFKGIAR